MDKYRCFIAIDLPAGVKAELTRMQKGFASWPVKVKWVEEQNLHLTLKFLGDVTGPQIADLQAGLAKVSLAHRRFKISIRGFGAFPGTRNPKVIWAGIDDPKQELEQLWLGIEDELAGRGFNPEVRPFSPHLTLGRVKDPRPGPGFQSILPNLGIAGCLVPVTEIKLMESRLSRSGPTYTCLQSFALQEHS